MICLSIPHSVRRKIREHSKDEEQQQHECIHYYLKSSPFALWGWEYLGGDLHYWGHEASLTAAKSYIQRAPGTCGCGMCMYWNVGDTCDCVCTLHSKSTHTHIYVYTHSHAYRAIIDTRYSISSVLDGVQRLDDAGGVGTWLQISCSKQYELKQQYDRRQLPRVYSTIFLTDNPSPSWSTVALALWQAGESRALEVIQKLYLKGEP